MSYLLLTKYTSQLSLFILLTLPLFISSCATAPPDNINNACAIIHTYPNWYQDALKSYHRWGTPVSVQFAIIRNESSFISNALPPRNYILGFIPAGRVSTAYGYAQALNGTWEHYQHMTGNYSAERTNFSDATDFIGWYTNQAHQQLGISQSNTYALYLAYYYGIQGYQQGNFSRSMKTYARHAQKWAWQYARDLNQCQY